MLTRTVRILARANYARTMHNTHSNSMTLSTLFTVQPARQLFTSRRADTTVSQEARGSDIVQMIKNEHRLVENLYGQYKRATSMDEKRQCAQLIVKNLSMHSFKEEVAVYPFIRRNVPNGDQIIDHSLHEHQQVKNDLYKLDNMNINDSNFDSLLHKTMADLSHHIKEEETNLLVQLSNHASMQELQRLYSDFKNAEKLAPTHPHPMAPNEGVAEMAAAAAAMPLDITKDLLRGVPKGTGAPAAH